ncbi:MAG: RNA polymerase-associated protein RapA, partial [Gammaproteobacteria bacterium]|nr:RNA polymerase-associated protein RapA [Gammaproteobacteria bacterium]
MQDYTVGQRWISDAEPELGLGTLVKREHRTITFIFPASGESRIYASKNAPITRVLLQPGDVTESSDGQILKVESVREIDGLMLYVGVMEDGSTAELAEEALSNFLQFNRPQERLFNGLIDDNHWFDLRRRTIEQQQQLAQSDLLGLGGVRTELLPHQLYIAHEVGRRLAPRVLLADEVGLGKTIEACLILHRQLLNGSVSRALIVVPEPLLHQWLVELMRRFNLWFSLFDEERCHAITESGQGDNPFQAEQLIICSLDLLTSSTQRLQQAMAADWDILIVDEAHHLEWHSEAPSPAYTAIDNLSRCIPGVLLLTATPEQLGRSGHFARLRLLDPDRFHNIEAFQQEEQSYQPVAEAATQLLEDNQLPQQLIDTLLQILEQDHATPLIEQLQDANIEPAEREQIRDELIEMLLDRHGTGRALFRNTRDRIKGFARRQLHSYPLPLPEPYSALAATTDPTLQLYPETIYPAADGTPWWQFDPRVEWLIEKLRELRGEKILLICAHAETAQGLEQALRQREGIAAALFHEQRSIVERDRAAAWFADRDQGCQILICSEIGSEGRNFQFAHHLALFDLPTNPDLLEQRIGRLDRIGQHHTVQLHAPYFQHSAQEVVLRWYNEGLNAFVHTCTPGQQIASQLQPELAQAMQDARRDTEALNHLLTTTRKLNLKINQQLQNGRDHLLELNSCRMQEANKLKQGLAAQDSSSLLFDYMDDLLAAFNLEVDFHTQQSLVIRPGAHMQVEHFPHLPEDGVTITYDRASALMHEDWQFLTWEHPMVADAMEMLLERENGNSSATAIRHPSLSANSIFLELLFVLECPAPKALQAGRYLPPTLIRKVMDQQRSELSTAMPPSFITENILTLDKNILRKLITPLRKRIQGMLQQAEQEAEYRRAQLIETAIENMQEQYSVEIDRLGSLKQVNPNIKPEDILRLQQQRSSLEAHMLASKVRLDAV